MIREMEYFNRRKFPLLNLLTSKEGKERQTNTNGIALLLHWLTDTEEKVTGST